MSDSLSVFSVIGYNPQEFLCTFALAITCDISGQQKHAKGLEILCMYRFVRTVIQKMKIPASSDVQIPVLPKHSEPIAILKVNDSPDDD